MRMAVLAKRHLHSLTCPEVRSEEETSLNVTEIETLV